MTPCSHLPAVWKDAVHAPHVAPCGTTVWGYSLTSVAEYGAVHTPPVTPSVIGAVALVTLRSADAALPADTALERSTRALRDGYMGSTTVFVTNKARLIDSSLSCVCPKHLSSLPGGAYLPVPHSRHTLCANAGFFASIQQNTGFCRSSSQHGLFAVSAVFVEESISNV